jgi:Domain of unknown function (DUF4202)
MKPLNDPDQARFEEAVMRFDEENARDLHRVEVDGQSLPREKVYAQWLSGWVGKLCPEASLELRLAARCQHIRRWAIPRDQYPPNRAGYLKWRADLKQFHARLSGEILREVGFPETVVVRVQDLNLKKNFPDDPETRVLEDALCLVFFEHQLADLASRTEEEKVVNALRKSWKKMTVAAQKLALELPRSPEVQRLLDRALN